MNKVNHTWIALNDLLRVSDEKTCAKLLKEEQLRDKPRKQYLKRIHSRLNKARADRERLELELIS